MDTVHNIDNKLASISDTIDSSSDNIAAYMPTTAAVDKLHMIAAEDILHITASSKVIRKVLS